MSLHGGHLKDIPKPHVRPFGDVPIGSELPDGTRAKKRPVAISIFRYTGLGHHYYASLAEEDNPIWNRSPEKWVNLEKGGGTWQFAWDDEGLKGRRFERSFVERKDALAWLRETARKRFSMKTHHLVWDPRRSSERRPQWIYKEGD